MSNTININNLIFKFSKTLYALEIKKKKNEIKM